MLLNFVVTAFYNHKVIKLKPDADNSTDATVPVSEDYGPGRSVVIGTPTAG